MDIHDIALTINITGVVASTGGHRVHRIRTAIAARLMARGCGGGATAIAPCPAPRSCSRHNHVANMRFQHLDAAEVWFYSCLVAPT
jgi:hypothetical protein